MLKVKVTNINGDYHARLLKDGKVIDEMVCTKKSSIGWICREMMRWYSKMGGFDPHAENARDRHNHDPMPDDKITYRIHIKTKKTQ